jgi:hypothetical protein
VRIGGGNERASRGGGGFVGLVSRLLAGRDHFGSMFLVFSMGPYLKLFLVSC